MIAVLAKSVLFQSCVNSDKRMVLITYRPRLEIALTKTTTLGDISCLHPRAIPEGRATNGYVRLGQEEN